MLLVKTQKAKAAESASEIHLSAPLCVLLILCLLVASSLPIRGVRVIVNKPSNRRRAAARTDGERRYQKCNHHFTVCVGCLKRHVSRERLPRAATLSTSPQCKQSRALQGIYAAINRLMIFYSKRDEALLLHQTLLL